MLKFDFLVRGIKLKIAQRANLEDILTFYVNLTEVEKQEIRQKISEEVI